MTFGQKLSKLRKENNYTQEQLADILCVSRQSVSKWESDVAYPETEKLISLSRLFNCTVDYLLKDECFEKKVCESNTKSPSNHQKIIGYILLTVSLLSVLPVVLLADNEDTIFILLTLVLSVVACSMLCLFINHNAWYWCIWAALSPITILLPFTIGLSVLNRINVIAIGFYVIMFFAAKKVFANVSLNQKNIRLIIIGWCALLIVRVFSYVLITHTVIYSVTELLPYVFMNLIMYVGFALLLTFSACIINSKKRVG